MSEQGAEYVTEPVQTATKLQEPVAATDAWKLYHDGGWQEFEDHWQLLRELLYLLKMQQPTMTETYRVERVR